MKRKSILWLMILVLGTALIFTGCGGQEGDKEVEENVEQQQEEDDSWEKVKEAGVLIAGLDDNYPPMGFRDENGKLTGFDIEMGNEIGKRLGIEVKWQPAAWDGIIAALKAKKFDVIISGMTLTEERMKEVDFAGPYIYAAQAIVVKEDNDTIKGLDDFKDRIIGTQSGSTGFKICTELKEDGIITKEFKDYADFGLAFQDLKIGRVEALIADDYVAEGYLREMPGEFKLVGEKFEEETNGIAVRKEDKELFNKLDQVIKEMINDGTLSELSEKWLHGDATEKLRNNN